MIQNIQSKFLFLVVLGGRVNKANIELHDVRWVVGSCIEDTFETLRSDWFGNLEGLHIDSYKKINYVDGYKIILKKSENKKFKNNNKPSYETIISQESVLRYGYSEPTKYRL